MSAPSLRLLPQSQPPTLTPPGLSSFSLLDWHPCCFPVWDPQGCFLKGHYSQCSAWTPHCSGWRSWCPVPPDVKLPCPVPALHSPAPGAPTEPTTHAPPSNTYPTPHHPGSSLLVSPFLIPRTAHLCQAHWVFLVKETFNQILSNLLGSVRSGTSSRRED